MLSLLTRRQRFSRKASHRPHSEPARRNARSAVLERLEDRTLLASLNVSGGALSYVGGVNVANNLSISTAGPTGKYTFTDAEAITLDAGAIAAGWTGSGTNTVIGPDSSVLSMAVDTRNKSDAVGIKSTDAPVTVTFTNGPSDVDTITIGGDSSKGAQGVNGSITIVNLNGSTNLTVDDSANPKAATVSLSSTKITGLLPGTTNSGQPNAIDTSKARLALLTYDEGKGGTTLTVSSTPKATTIVNTGVGAAALNATTVQSTTGPLTLNAQGTDSITLGAAPAGVQNLAGAVSLTNSPGGTIATLNVDDSADTLSRTATISSTTVTGLAPATIDYSAVSELNVLNVKGGQGGNHFTVASLPDAIVTLFTGAGATIDPGNPNSNTLGVENTTDAANGNLLNVSTQGLDTINLASSVGINVTGGTKLLTVPISLTINAPGSGDQVTFTNSASGSINGAAQLVGAPASMAVTIDDSADTSARTVAITQGVITGLLPAPISYNPDIITSLTIIGGSRFATLNINAEKHGPVSVVAGADIGSGTVTIDTTPPLIYSNVVAVNVTNAADEDLLSQNKPIVTTTGDLSTEGKALPYLVASFIDSDPNARSGNFTAVIDWGDGSPTTPGSIASHGFVNGQPLFDVTANHTYLEAGTYAVVVSITDLGTAAVPSIIGGIPVTVADLGGSALQTGSVTQVNLTSDGSISAAHTDSNLKDPWGIAASPTGPFWVSDRRTGVSSLYDGSGNPQSLVVTIPSPGGAPPPSTPTGVAYNADSGAFDLVSGDPSTSAVFLFVTQDGTISGWSPNVLPATSAVLKVDNSAAGADYTGLAVAQNGGSSFLYAANFHSGMVEMYDQTFAAAGSFTDSTLPPDYAPYNIANIGGDLYVTFARQDAARHDPVAGLGNGFVDVFSPSGVMLSRFASNAPLNEPWGMALAPSNFGQFSGDLLIANHGDGRINAFDPATGVFLGPFIDGTNQPVVINGLRGLSFGNGASAGKTNTLYFTAGPGGGTQGLFGSLTPASNTATIIEGALKASIVNVAAVEGNPFIGVVANFTDDNPRSQASDFTATIDWGDGSVPTAGEIIAGNGLGAFLVVVDSSLAHTYTDETGSPLHPQPLNISITIAETDGRASVIAAGFANVADASLLSATGIDPSGEAVEGVPLADEPITLATFIDNNPLATPADYITNGVMGTALIDWGDGSTSLGTIVDAGSTALGESFDVTGDHTYLKVGPSTIRISVTDIGGKTASMVANVQVFEAPLDAAAAPLAGFEGFPLLTAAGSDVVPVATFTDVNTFATPIDFRATIDWGDGSSGGGTILAGGLPGSFIVVASHRYAEAGTYPTNILIDDSAGDNGGARAVTTGAAVIADAPLVRVVTAPVSGVEGQGLSAVTLGAFTDINPSAKTADFAVTIGWGDSTTEIIPTGTVSITGGTSVGISAAANIAAGTGVNFKITGSHSYKEEGTFTIAVTVTDADGAAFAFTTRATVADAPLPDIEVGTLVAAVGVAVPKGTLVARFQDANVGATVDDFIAIVDYGDGNGNVGATVESLGDGGFQILSANPVTYNTPGDKPIVAYVRDQGNNIIAIGRNDADVARGAPPPPVLVAVGILIGRERSKLDPVVASFTDADPSSVPSDFAATIDWSDGTSTEGAINLVGGTGMENHFQVAGDHIYAEEGSYPVYVTLTTRGNNPQTVNTTAQIADAALTAEHATFNAPESVSMTQVVATFTDDNSNAAFSDFSATINWGDGSTSAGVITQPSGLGTPFLVSGTHKYDDSGGSQEMDGFPVIVTITDVGGSVAIATSQANVFDPVLVDPGVNVKAVAGAPFQGQVASFSTTDLSAKVGEFTAVVNWGDGQASSGAIVETGAGSFLVMGEHTYAQWGTYSVSVTIADDEGQSVSDSSIATVAPASIQAQAVPIVAVPHKLFSGTVATFTDPSRDAAGSFTVRIFWGDGSTSAGVVVASASPAGGSSFTVLGKHAYARRKSYAGEVIITRNGSSGAIVPIVAAVGTSRQMTKTIPLAAEHTGKSTGSGKSHAQPARVRSIHPSGPRSSFKRRYFVNVNPGALSPAPAGVNTNLPAASSLTFPTSGGPSA
jgi:uncharacterized protein (TIGR03118 family)